MSQAGIRIMSGVFSALQMSRVKLLEMGSRVPATKSGQQDIMLGQLLEKAKDSIKDDFLLLTTDGENKPRSKGRPHGKRKTSPRASRARPTGTNDFS